MKGSIINRGRDKWLLKWEGPRVGGKRNQCYRTITGSKSDAQRELRDVLKKVDEGQHVDKSTVTVGEWLDKWIERAEVAGLSARSAERYKQFIGGQIKAHLGTVKLQALTLTAVKDWHTALLSGERPLAGRTVGHVHRLLRRALNDAVAENIVAANVAAKAKPPKVAKSEAEILTAEQAQAVLAALRGKALYLPVAIALWSGARRGEILALKWNDFDFVQATMRIDESVEETEAHGRRLKSPKTASGRRTISIGAGLISELKAHRQKRLEQRMALGLGKLPEDALLFCHLDGEPLSPNKLSWEWNRLAKRLSLGGVRFHCLRHTHASHLLKQGVDVVTVSKRLGHASPGITMSTYAHLIGASDAHAADAIDKALGTI